MRTDVQVRSTTADAERLDVLGAHARASGSDASDIEDLKVHKIERTVDAASGHHEQAAGGQGESALVRREDGRVALGVYGQVEPSAEVREAFGGRIAGADGQRGAPGAAGAGADAVANVDRDVLRSRIVETLKTIYDPEIPVNVYDLGLIYGFEIDEAGDVELTMTLTAPACPVAGQIVEEVARRTGEVEGVRRSHVTLTWDPPWTRDRMTEEALLELGLL
jgi:FeS assembly SUF system protein